MSAARRTAVGEELSAAASNPIRQTLSQSLCVSDPSTHPPSPAPRFDYPSVSSPLLNSPVTSPRSSFGSVRKRAERADAAGAASGAASPVLHNQRSGGGDSSDGFEKTVEFANQTFTSVMYDCLGMTERQAGLGQMPSDTTHNDTVNNGATLPHLSHSMSANDKNLSRVFSASAMSGGGVSEGGTEVKAALMALDTLIQSTQDAISAEDVIWSVEQDAGKFQWDAYFTTKFGSGSGLSEGHQREDRAREQHRAQIGQKLELAIDAKHAAEQARRRSEAELRKLIVDSVRPKAVAQAASVRTTRHVRLSKQAMAECIDGGDPADVTLHTLGVTLGNGLVVTRMEGKNSSAMAGAGLTCGARIIAVNGKRVTLAEDVDHILKNNPPGEGLVFTVSEFRRRGGSMKQKSMVRRSSVASLGGRKHSASVRLEGAGNLIESDDEEEWLPGLYVTPPAIYAQGAGWYGLVEGQMVNGFPVWERQTGSGSLWYLFSTSNEKWALASSQFAMTNNQAELLTSLSHGGVMPIYFDGEWMENEEGEWVAAEGMRVVDQSIPPVDNATAITLVIDPKGAGGGFCGAGASGGHGFTLLDDLSVDSVAPGSAADRAGVMPESKLVAVDGRLVDTTEEAEAAMEGRTEVFCVTLRAFFDSGAKSGVSQSLNPMKGGFESYASLKSSFELRLFGEKLMAEWDQKSGSIIDELISNLVFPAGMEPTKQLATAAMQLQAKKGRAYPDKNPVELLIMQLYTMAGPDIDALVGFDNVPIYDSDRQKDWDDYVAKHKDRNQAIFSAINWASRTASDSNSKSLEEAWTTLKKWIKFIGLLLALSSETRGAYAHRVWRSLDPNDTETCKKAAMRKYAQANRPFAVKLGPLMAEVDGEGSISKADFFRLLARSDPTSQGDLVARGITGLPQEVLENHQNMSSRGTQLHWPAPASCAFDRSVSEAYIRGDASNANKSDGESILFLISETAWGLPLQSISQYPKEAELLLPPLTTFEVNKAKDGASIGLGGVLVMELNCVSVLGATALVAFCNVARVDSMEAAENLKRVFVKTRASRKAPPGTPVEVMAGKDAKGVVRWKQGTIVKATPTGYVVEWQDEREVRTVEIEEEKVRVLPMSNLLSSHLGPDLFDDKRFVKHELELGVEEGGDWLEGVTLLGRVVRSVEPGSRAEQMGVYEGATVAEVQGIEVHDEDDIREIMRSTAAQGRELRVELWVPKAEARVRVLEQVMEDIGLERKASRIGDVRGVGFTGNMVEFVKEGSAAERAGLRAGCTITKIGNESIDRTIDSAELISKIEKAGLKEAVILYPEVASGNESRTLRAFQTFCTARAAVVTKGAARRRRSSSVRSAEEEKTQHAEEFGLELEGLAVVSVAPHSAADKAGLLPGHILTSVNGRDVASPEDVSEALGDIEVGEPCTVAYLIPPASTHMVQVPVSCDGSSEAGGGGGVASAGSAGRRGRSLSVSVTSDALEASYLGASVKTPTVSRIETRRLSLHGASVETLGLTLEGTTVVQVAKGSHAEKAGLASGVVLREVNGVKVLNENDAAGALVSALRGGAAVDIVAEVPHFQKMGPDVPELTEELNEANAQLTKSREEVRRVKAEHARQLTELNRLLSEAAAGGVGGGGGGGGRAAQGGESSDTAAVDVAMTQEELDRLIGKSIRDVVAEAKGLRKKVRALEREKGRERAEDREQLERRLEKTGATVEKLEEEKVRLVEQQSQALESLRAALSGASEAELQRLQRRSEASGAAAAAVVREKDGELRQSRERHLSEVAAAVRAAKALKAENDRLAKENGELRTQLAAAPPQETLSAMWKELKQMHRELDKLIGQKLRLDESDVPEDAYEMKRELTCVRQRIRDAESARDLSSTSRSRSLVRSTTTTTGAEGRSGSLGGGGSGNLAATRASSVSPSAVPLTMPEDREYMRPLSRSPRRGRSRSRSRSPRVPSRSPREGGWEAFSKFGVSLSASLHIPERGVISYSGLRVVEACPPAAPLVKPNDVLTHLDGRPVSTLEDLQRDMEDVSPGSHCMFRLRRWCEGSILTKNVNIRTMATRSRPGSPSGVNLVALDRTGEAVRTKRERRSPRRRRLSSAARVSSVHDEETAEVAAAAAAAAAAASAAAAAPAAVSGDGDDDEEPTVRFSERAPRRRSAQRERTLRAATVQDPLTIFGRRGSVSPHSQRGSDASDGRSPSPPETPGASTGLSGAGMLLRRDRDRAEPYVTCSSGASTSGRLTPPRRRHEGVRVAVSPRRSGSSSGRRGGGQQQQRGQHRYREASGGDTYTSPADTSESDAHYRERGATAVTSHPAPASPSPGVQTRGLVRTRISTL